MAETEEHTQILHTIMAVIFMNDDEIILLLLRIIFIYSINEPNILFYDSLESNPGAPHTVNKPNILFYN